MQLIEQNQLAFCLRNTAVEAWLHSDLGHIDQLIAYQGLLGLIRQIPEKLYLKELKSLAIAQSESEF